MDKKEIKFLTSEITNKYIAGQSMSAFADELGIGASRQMVWMWKEGKQAPDFLTLTKVILSNSSTELAVQWAKECSAVYLKED